MTRQFHYELQWPRDNIFLYTYAHELYNYRYHWHDSDYEIDIVLKGRAEFCRGQKTFLLEEDDIIFTNPGIWHASFSREENSKALVLRFSDKVFRNLLKPEERFNFYIPASDASTRQDSIYRKIRYYAAKLLQSASQSGSFQNLDSRAAFEMLLSTVCSHEDKEVVRSYDPNERNMETVKRLLRYIDDHFAEKLSLEDLANYTQYNRTYVSTLFKNTIGINFHEYLTRVRLSHAIFQLAVTDKSMTQIALDCGFPDLKIFNQRFRDIFHYLPTEYRQRLDPNHIVHLRDQQVYISPKDPLIAAKLEGYMDVF